MARVRFGLRNRWAALGVLTTLLTMAVAPSAAASTTDPASTDAGSTAQQSTAGSTSGSTTGADAVPGPVILLGTGGLRWSDVTDDRPALQNLQDTAAVGWLAVRSVRSTTCPADGWLAVSAGSRAADTAAQDDEAVCRDPEVTVDEPGGSASVTQWDRYVEQAADDDFDATPGLLGDTLADASIRTAAVGAGATIALAGTDGRAPQVWAGSQDDPQALAADVDAALATGPQVLAVDLGAVIDPDEQRASDVATRPALTGSYALPRAEQVDALEQRLEAVVSELPTDATVIVASLADSGARSQLRTLAATGPAPGGGSYADALLGSSSTRQDGLAQTTDLLPTILSALGLATPDAAVGSALRPVQTGTDAADRELKLSDLDEAAVAVNPIVQPFFMGLVAAQVILYLIVTLVLRRRSRGQDTEAVSARRELLLRRLRRIAVVFACVPAATFLANLLPWWRAGSPGLAVTGAVLVFVVPMALIANLGPWRQALLGPMGAVGAMTMLVLAADALTGSHLILSSLMGLQPVVAGRFYGFGNPAFSLFATGALLTAIAAADTLVRRGRRPVAAAVIGALGLFATVIDGMPGIGSDFGGPPAIIPAFAVLALLALGIRVTWRRALVILLVTLGVIVALSVLDWLRGPEDRTHLGRFVQTVIDGGAWPVLKRKAEQNLRILFTSYLSALLPIAAAFVVLVLARPVSWGVRPLQLAYDRSPMLRSGLIAFGIMMLIGFAMNDSGVSIPAVAATVALPLLIAASVRALELARTPNTAGQFHRPDKPGPEETTDPEPDLTGPQAAPAGEPDPADRA